MLPCIDFKSMKAVYFTLGFIMFSMFCIGQNWAPIGATWYYTEGFATSGDVDYFKIESAKDTLIQGKTCKKLMKRHKPLCADRPDVEFMYSENNRVYFLDTNFNSFQNLYDFNANTGDQWIIKIKNYHNPQIADTLFVHVDSTTVDTINGYPLKKLFVKYIFHNDVNPNYNYTSIIIEKIGDLQYMFNYAPSTSFSCDFNFSVGLRCYSDTVIGNYQTGITSSCDYVNIGISEKRYYYIEVFPNPASSYILLELPIKQSIFYKIVSVYGTECLSGTTENNRINIESLVKGLYLLEIYDLNDNILAFAKFIKN
jgi:hypothetical protein